MDHDFCRDDWEVGFKHIIRDGRDRLARVRNQDRDHAYAYYLTLHDKDYSHSVPYLERADGATWEQREKPVAPSGYCYRGGQLVSVLGGWLC